MWVSLDPGSTGASQALRTTAVGPKSGFTGLGPEAGDMGVAYNLGLQRADLEVGLQGPVWCWSKPGI